MWGKKNPDEMSPLDATAEHETGWLGSSLQVKGEITGTEDLQIDGAVEGRIHLDERKLTVGTTAKVTADIEARDVVAREGTDRDQEGWRDHREFDDGADHDRRRRGLQRFDRNREGRGGAGGDECRFAGGSGWRGVEKR